MRWNSQIRWKIKLKGVCELVSFKYLCFSTSFLNLLNIYSNLHVARTLEFFILDKVFKPLLPILGGDSLLGVSLHLVSPPTININWLGLLDQSLNIRFQFDPLTLLLPTSLHHCPLDALLFPSPTGQLLEFRILLLNPLLEFHIPL